MPLLVDRVRCANCRHLCSRRRSDATTRYDPYFNEDEYQRVLHAAGSAAARCAGRSDPHRAVAAGARAVRPARHDHGRRDPNHVPQHRRSRQSDGGDRHLLRAVQRLAGRRSAAAARVRPRHPGPGRPVRAVASVQPGHPLAAVSGPRVQLRGAVRRDDGRARIRDRDDRLSGSRHAGPAHLRRPASPQGNAMLDAGPRREAAAGHVAGSRWARLPFGATRRAAERRRRRPNWRRRTHRSSTSSAPTPARRPPTSRSCSRTPTAASLSAPSGTRSTR